jgi:hypothetical protein
MNNIGAMKLATKAKLKNLIGRSRCVYELYLAFQRVQCPSIVAGSDRFWSDSRNKHAGIPGFVIGNGPSLKMDDLEALKGQVCVASNKIYLAFNSVAWRPTYYSCSDWLVWSKIRSEVPKYFGSPLLLNTFGLSTFPRGGIMMRNLGLFNTGAQGFSFDSRRGQYGGLTVTFNNLQTAVHLGLNPIFLIGCDHFYSGETKANEDKPLISHGGASNHFVPNYRAPGEIVNMAPIETMNAAFRCARVACDATGIKILNATRGGHLDVFERASLDNVLRALR